MDSFEEKKLIEIHRMSLDELNRYYRYLRKYEFENNKPLESSELKKRIHKLTMLVLKIDRFFSRRKLEIFDDKRGDYKNIGKGIVYEKQPGKQYKEVIELEYDIGYNVDEEGNVVEKTNSFVTHYSNKRTHACPTKRSIKKDETK